LSGDIPGDNLHDLHSGDPLAKDGTNWTYPPNPGKVTNQNYHYIFGWEFLLNLYLPPLLGGG